MSQRSFVCSPLSVAPMMGCTDRHFRYFMRLISRKTLLYTEMITSSAILHGRHRNPQLLAFSPIEKPLVLQIAGTNPKDLASCATIAEDWGYDELNLNIGCPSLKAQQGGFGACLMARPKQVAECFAAIQQATHLPVSIKHRLGLSSTDYESSYADLSHFVEQVAAAGCRKFIVHARIAILKNSSSPKQNRTVPPLRYDIVKQLARDFPHIDVEINGGIHDLDKANELLYNTGISSVMIGRSAYENPYCFAFADQRFYGATYEPLSRRQILVAIQNYYASLTHKQAKQALVKHLLNLFTGLPGARSFRRHLSSNWQEIGEKFDKILTVACQNIPQAVLDNTNETCITR